MQFGWIHGLKELCLTLNSDFFLFLSQDQQERTKKVLSILNKAVSKNAIMYYSGEIL